MSPWRWEQTISGPVNGGSTIVFNPGDQFTNQPVTANNIPAGFTNPVHILTQFHTANGSVLELANGPATLYAAAPAAAVQPSLGIRSMVAALWAQGFTGRLKFLQARRRVSSVPPGPVLGYRVLNPDLLIAPSPAIPKDSSFATVQNTGTFTVP